MKLFASAFIVGCLASRALFAQPEITPLECIGEDDQFSAKVEFLPGQALNAYISQEGSLKETLPCYLDEEGFRYRCGIRDPQGNWDETYSIFQIRHKHYVDSEHIFALYIGEEFTRDMMCKEVPEEPSTQPEEDQDKGGKGSKGSKGADRQHWQ